MPVACQPSEQRKGVSCSVRVRSSPARCQREAKLWLRRSAGVQPAPYGQCPKNPQHDSELPSRRRKFPPRPPQTAKPAHQHTNTHITQPSPCGQWDSQLRAILKLTLGGGQVKQRADKVQSRAMRGTSYCNAQGVDSQSQDHLWLISLWLMFPVLVINFNENNYRTS